MKKIVMFTSLIFLLISCNDIDENKESINNSEETSNVVLKNIKIEERKIFLEDINKFYKEYNNLEFKKNSCPKDMFLWNNIEDNFKLCLPNNWVGYSEYSGNIYDLSSKNTENNLLFSILGNKDKLKTNYSENDLINFNIERKDDFSINKKGKIIHIKNNKVFINNINILNKNYKNSNLIIDTGKDIIKFIFNIKNYNHRKVIKSLEVLN